MPETALLRFRDHIADIDTVKEHLKLIARFKYVWWGWWRKESEPDHRRDLEDLQSRAREKPITIGLFDSSTGRYFVARAVEFVHRTAHQAPPEREWIPAYYPDISAVEAWIKLVSIEATDIAEFVELFGQVPTGERTFFSVNSDRAPLRKIAGEYVSVASDFVVHLSDLHFGTDYGFPAAREPGKETLIARLEQDLRNLCGSRIGLVIVSGDLTTKADANALTMEALDFLRSIHDELHVPKEAILVVPGNHDFRLAEYQPTNFSHERPFNMMLDAFYGGYDPDDRLRRFVFPSGHRVEFLLINSVRLRKIEEANYGYVEWPLYENRLREAPKEPDVTRVAVLHHHLISMPREEAYDNDYKHAGISTTWDSGAVIEGLQAHGFRLALHGHQHMPGIASISRGIINGNNAAMPQPDLALLSAGSAGARIERLPNLMRDNSYNLLEFAPTEIRIESRRYNAWAPGSRYFQARLVI
jgi:predicted MPP superfamily phosphohydrolase